MRCYFSRNENASFVLEMSDSSAFLTNLSQNSIVPRRFLAFERISRDMLAVPSLSLLFLFPGLGDADLQDLQLCLQRDSQAVFRLQAVDVESGEATTLEIAPERPQFLVFKQIERVQRVDLARLAVNLRGNGRIAFWMELHGDNRNLQPGRQDKRQKASAEGKEGSLAGNAAKQAGSVVHCSGSVGHIELQLLGSDQVVDAAERWIGAAVFYYRKYLRCGTECIDKSDSGNYSDGSEPMRCRDQQLLLQMSEKPEAMESRRSCGADAIAQTTMRSSSLEARSPASAIATADAAAQADLQASSTHRATQSELPRLSQEASPLERNTAFYATRGCQCESRPAVAQSADQCQECLEIRVQLRKTPIQRSSGQSSFQPLSSAKTNLKVRKNPITKPESAPAQLSRSESQNRCFLGGEDADPRLKCKDVVFPEKRSKTQISGQTPCISPAASSTDEKARGSAAYAKPKTKAGVSGVGSPPGSPLRQTFPPLSDSPDLHDARKKDRTRAQETKASSHQPAPPDSAAEISVSESVLQQRAQGPEKQKAAKFLSQQHRCLAYIKRAPFMATAEFSKRELSLTSPRGKRSVFPISMAEEGFNFTHNDRAAEFYAVVSQLEQQAAQWLVLQKSKSNLGGQAERGGQEPHCSDYLVYKRAFCVCSGKQWLLLLLSEQDGEAFRSLFCKSQ